MKNLETAKESMNDRIRFFRKYLRTMPVSLSFWRAYESARYSKETLVNPVLDVGCGDGLFVKSVFGQKLEAGIDLDAGEIRRAAKSGCYVEVHCTSVTNMPFPDGKFKTVFSNCVMEHVPPIQEGLNEISRVMASGGRFMFTVPSEYYSRSFFGDQVLRALGLPGLGKKYVDFVNKTFKHFNLDSHEVWEERLRKAGLMFESYEYLISPSAMRQHERWFLPAIPSKIWKTLFGRWVLFPRFLVIWCAPMWFKKSFDSSDENGVCYFIVAQKP
jgi:SAM-dependent methyltransferase